MATWNFDKTHTNISFSTRHMMVTTVRGNFAGFDGTLEFDPANLAASSVDVTIDAASINTNVADRDNHLKSPDFFDVATYPTITFKSTGVQLTGEKTGKITGDLTIRDVTKSVVLDAEFLGTGTNPWGAQVAGFTASTKINREDFGLTWNVGLEAGGVLVSKDIKIELDVEAVLAQQPEASA